MADFLTRRSGTWHFVRRVPMEFAHFDRRGIIKHSTKVRIAQDRTGRRAARVADKLNEELELYWKALADGRSPRVVLFCRKNIRRGCAGANDVAPAAARSRKIANQKRRGK